MNDPLKSPVCSNWAF